MPSYDGRILPASRWWMAGIIKQPSQFGEIFSEGTFIISSASTSKGGGARVEDSNINSIQQMRRDGGWLYLVKDSIHCPDCVWWKCYKRWGKIQNHNMLMAVMTSPDFLKWPETPQANLKSTYLVTLIYPFVLNFDPTFVTPWFCGSLLKTYQVILWPFRGIGGQNLRLKEELFNTFKYFSHVFKLVSDPHCMVNLW